MHHYEEDFWLLAGLKLSGEATDKELELLSELLQHHPELGLRLEMLSAMWKQTHAGAVSNKKEIFDRHFQRLSKYLSEPEQQYETVPDGDTVLEEETSVKPRKKYRRLWWASGVAASVLAGWFFLKNAEGNPTNTQQAQNTVYTKRASKSKIDLPDGTQVWLNADSKITYNEKFKGEFREVQLSGEAYFDVVKDEKHPFIIHTSTMDIKVLGTAFNVRCYPNEKKTETSLIRGSVEVTIRNNPEKKIILKPHEKLVVQNDREEIASGASQLQKTNRKQEAKLVLGKVHYPEGDTIATESLWIKNKLAFDGEPLEQIALKLERWYDVSVTIANNNLKKKEFTGVFEDESLPEVMEALRLVGKFRYSIKKNEVIIRP